MSRLTITVGLLLASILCIRAELSCPVISSEDVGTCQDSCTSNSNCPVGAICCSNGCGHSCVQPVTSTHDGECPRLSLEVVGTCVESCAHDGNCSANQKCCSNGCGHACIEAVFPEIRPGTCPSVANSTFGVCVNLCNNDLECPTNHKCCSNGCGYACMGALDVPSCPEIMCMRYCPYGFRKDNAGCNICDCNSPAEIHAGQCPIVSSEQVGVCSELCEHDGNCSANHKCCSNGCGHQCTEAVQPGVIKSGTCPALIDGIVGVCAEGCAADQECPNNEKCCSNGCGHTCVEPEVRVRPGVCPNGSLSEGQIGSCYEACVDDGDCLANQKCCSNGCGHACITVVEPGPACSGMMCKMFCEYGFVRDDQGCDTCVCNNPPAEHLGICPVNSDGGIGICSESCLNDDDCDAHERCCSNGCGHTCQAAVGVPVIHQGSCPVGRQPNDVEGLCVEGCSGDRSCAANQKCCSNGCGHECVDIAPDCSDRVLCAMFCEHGNEKDDDGCDICQCREPADCSDRVLCAMFCEHGNEKDDDGCDICQCREPVTCPLIMCNMWCEHGFQQDDGCDICRCASQPGRPGSCPDTTDRGLFGVCINECVNDRDCTSNQKCCHNGCGMTCTTPVPDVSVIRSVAYRPFAAPILVLIFASIAVVLVRN